MLIKQGDEGESMYLVEAGKRRAPLRRRKNTRTGWHGLLALSVVAVVFFLSGEAVAKIGGKVVLEYTRGAPRPNLRKPALYPTVAEQVNTLPSDCLTCSADRGHHASTGALEFSHVNVQRDVVTRSITVVSLTLR